MTLSFSVFLALILIIELGAGIASYAFREQVIPSRESTYLKKVPKQHDIDLDLLQVGSIIEKNMEKGLQNYGIEEYKGVTETWNIVQHEVQYDVTTSAVTE